MDNIEDLACHAEKKYSRKKQPRFLSPLSPTIFQLSKPLYSITVDDEETPLSCLYEHGYFWQLNIGHVRLLEFSHTAKPFQVLTIPRPIADLVEARYTEKDSEYGKISPWPDIALSVIIRAGKRLKGKKPGVDAVMGVLKGELREVIQEDISVDIRSLARDLARANRGVGC